MQLVFLPVQQLSTPKKKLNLEKPIYFIIQMTYRLWKHLVQLFIISLSYPYTSLFI